MNYVKGTLSGLAAIFLAEFVPGPWSMVKGIREQKATGLGRRGWNHGERLFASLLDSRAFVLCTALCGQPTRK